MIATSSGMVLAAIALVLALVALLPRAEVGHPLVALVRVLVPSWRFFDDVQVTPALRVRVACTGGEFETGSRSSRPRRDVRGTWCGIPRGTSSSRSMHSSSA